MNRDMTVSLVRSASLLRLEVFAERCALHPDLIRRLVAIGLVEPAARSDGHLWFTPTQIHRIDKMMRIRNDLGINYNAIGLILDLLHRIEVLERISNPPPPGALED